MSPATVAADRIALAAVGIGAPVGISLVLAPGDETAVLAGSLASMGALAATVMDVGAAGFERVRRVSLAAFASVIGFALGSIVHGHPPATFLAVIGAALVSGLSGAVSRTASKSAIFFLMFVVMAANVDFGPAAGWTPPAAVAAGAVWRVALTVLVAAVLGRALGPERRAVAEVCERIADQLAAPAGAPRRQAAIALSAAISDADETMAGSRTPFVLRDRRWQRLSAQLAASRELVDAAIAVDVGEHRVPGADVLFLRALARSIRDRSPAPSPPAPIDAAQPEEAALDAAVRRLGDMVAASGEASEEPATDPRLRDRLRRARRTIGSSAELWGAVGRLVLCVAVAQGLCIAWNLPQPYLVVLAVAQIMKPDLGSVFARAMQRGVGTLIGVGIGSLAVTMIPRDGWQILLIVVLAAGIPVVMPRNYGLYSIVTTPLSVLLVELHAGVQPMQVGSRLADTLLGCAIVLVLGYAVWPSTWRASRTLAISAAALVADIAEYARGASDAAVPGADGRRRTVYRQIGDLRILIAQSAADPPVVRRATVSWIPAVDAFERTADALTAARFAAMAAGERLDAASVAVVADALDDVASAIVRGRRPAAGVLEVSAALRTSADAVVEVRRGVVAEQLRHGQATAQ